MKWIIVAALALAALPVAAADPTPYPGLHETRTAAGSFYLSALTQKKSFPFSDVVQTRSGLVFLSCLVGTDAEGVLVKGL